jgi:hypothetical protein
MLFADTNTATSIIIKVVYQEIDQTRIFQGDTHQTSFLHYSTRTIESDLYMEEGGHRSVYHKPLIDCFA